MKIADEGPIDSSRFAIHRVFAAMMSEGEAARKLAADLFEISNALGRDVVTDALEVEEDRESVGEPDESSRRRDDHLPAGWSSFRSRISRAFWRVDDGTQRVFRKPWKICFGICPGDTIRPDPLTLYLSVASLYCPEMHFY